MVSRRRQRRPRSASTTTPSSSRSSRSTPPITRRPTSGMRSCGSIAPPTDSPSTSRRSRCSPSIRRGRQPLYKDLRPETDKARLYPKDVEPKVVDEVWERFLSALEPLHDAGKLGAVLFQFPQWFPIGKANKTYILECQRRCAPYSICVEFRNRTWLSDDNREETLDFLRSYQVPYVCVDMPQGYPSSVPPVVEATADLAVVRFHGHSDKWQSNDIYERFGYKYSAEELREWAPRVQWARRAGEHGARADEQLLSRLRAGQRATAGRPVAGAVIDQGGASFATHRRGRRRGGIAMQATGSKCSGSRRPARACDSGHDRCCRGRPGVGRRLRHRDRRALAHPGGSGRRAVGSRPTVGPADC